MFRLEDKRSSRFWFRLGREGGNGGGDEKKIFGPSEEKGEFPRYGKGGGSLAKSCTRLPPPAPNFPVSRSRGKTRSKTNGRFTFPMFFVFFFLFFDFSTPTSGV